MFNFKLTKAARINPDAFNPYLLQQLRETAKKLDARFTLTIATWQGEKPKFETQIHLSSAEASLQPAMTGPQKGIDKWQWLNGGTRVRYAVMSGDWKSKTTPGFVGSGPGAGRVAFVDVNHPQPGIEARGWTGIIAKEFKSIFKSAMQTAMQAGAAHATEG